MEQHGYTFIEMMEELNTSRNHIVNKGLFPNRIYLGKKQMKAIEEYHNETFSFEYDIERVRIFDLKVVPVDEEHHVAMGFKN